MNGTATLRTFHYPQFCSLVIFLSKNAEIIAYPLINYVHFAQPYVCLTVNRVVPEVYRDSTFNQVNRSY